MNPIAAFLLIYLLPQLVRAKATISSRIPRRVAAIEAKNKAKALTLVGRPQRYVKGKVVRKTLSESLKNTGRATPHESIWLTEGIAVAFARKEQNLDDLSPAVEKLESRQLLMTHTGLSMARSFKRLNQLDSRASSELSALTAFANKVAIKGYRNAMLEPIGVTAVVFYKIKLIPKLTLAASNIDKNLEYLIWRGVGRGLYLYWKNLIPSSTTHWRTLSWCISFSSDTKAQNNMLSGYSGALFLINMRSPEVIEEYIKHYVAQGYDTNPLISAMMTAYVIERDCSESDELIDRLLDYKANDEILWQRYVVKPLQNSKNKLYPKLKKTNQLDKIFTYHSPDLLI